MNHTRARRPDFGAGLWYRRQKKFYFVLISIRWKRPPALFARQCPCLPRVRETLHPGRPRCSARFSIYLSIYLPWAFLRPSAPARDRAPTIWRRVLGRLACQQGRERGIKTPALLALLCVHASALHLQPNNRPVLSQFCGIRRRALAGVYVPPVFLSWSRPQQTPPRELPRCSTGFVNRCVIGSPNATPSTA